MTAETRLFRGMSTLLIVFSCSNENKKHDRDAHATNRKTVLVTRSMGGLPMHFFKSIICS